MTARLAFLQRLLDQCGDFLVAILRAVFWHSLALATLVGVLVLLQAKVVPWMIPR